MIRRERARQRTIVAAASVAAVAFAALAVAATWFGRQAEVRRAQAFNALTRVFAERSWQAIERGDYPLAARYAVAGYRIAPQQEQEYRAALARILHDSNESVFLPHGAAVNSLRYSPDGARLLTIDQQGAVRVWDAETGREHWRKSGEHTTPQAGRLDQDAEQLSAVDATEFSSDGRLIIAVESGDHLRAWDAETGALVFSRPIGWAVPQPSGSVYAVGDGADVIIANLDDGREIYRISGPLDDQLDEISFSDDGAHLAAHWISGQLHVWRVGERRRLVSLFGQEDEALGYAGVKYSARGNRLAIDSFSGTVRVADARTGEVISSFRAHGDALSAVALSPDGSRVLTAAAGSPSQLWDADSGTVALTLDDARLMPVGAVFSYDGARIVTLTREGPAYVWDANSGRLVTTLRGHSGYLMGAAFNPDHTGLATISIDGTARLWPTIEGRGQAVLTGHEGAINSARFSPDGARVLTASEDGTARIWDAASAREVAVLCGHEAAVANARYRPDGDNVVTASLDGAVRLWRADDGAPIMSVYEADPGGMSPAFDAQYSPDSNSLLLLSHRGTALWDVRTGQGETIGERARRRGQS